MTIEDSEIQVTDTANEKTGSLAKVIEYSTIDSVIGRNINVSANRETGSLVGNITSSLVQDTHVIGVTVSGTNRVGAIAGYVDRTQPALFGNTLGRIRYSEYLPDDKFFICKG